MAPTLFSGDIVFYRPLNKKSNSLKKGSIVVASHPRKNKIFLIKRVKEMHNFGIELIGDNHENSTDSRQYGLIHHNLIKGTVEFLIRNKY